jgi:transcriptional regulator with XRE-family HTH domain
MPHGYSQYTISANKSADKRLIGVALGRACIARGVPVAEVADKFGVSRQTIYNWFGGKHVPKPELLRAVSAYVASLTK